MTDTDVIFKRAEGTDRFHPLWTATYQPTISDDPADPAPWMDVKLYRPAPGTHDPSELLQKFTIGFTMRPGAFEVTARPQPLEPLIVHMIGIKWRLPETGEMMISKLKIPWVEYHPVAPC